MTAPWSEAAMVLAERERRALVTVIDGRIAIVLPHSVARADAVDDPQGLAKLLARITSAVDEALS